jgi:hypothetical protein
MAHVILHAGSQKTGTTTIQSVLHDNRAALAARGIWYPPVHEFFPVDPALQSARAHHAVAGAVARWSDADRRRLDGFTRALRAAGDHHEHVVLSAETLYRLTAPEPDDPEDGGYAARRRYVARLAEVFDGLGAEVLLWLRRADAFAESLYASAIFAWENETSPGLEQFIAALPYCFDYRFQTELFAEFFPLRSGSFEARAASGLVAGFFADAGIGPPPSGPEPRLRPSVPLRAVPWMQRVKAAGGPGGGSPKRARQALRRRWLYALQPAAAEVFGAGEPASFWPDVAVRDAFIARAQAGVHEPDFPPPGKLPPPCVWDDASHARAEAEFAAWEQENAAWIGGREAARVPPFHDAARPVVADKGTCPSD